MKVLTAFIILALTAIGLPAQWIELNNTPLHDTQQFEFVTETFGYILGAENSSWSKRDILKTTDGGQNWTVLTMPDSASQYMAISAPTATTIYMIGRKNQISGPQNSQVYKSTDSGSSWQDVTPDSTSTGFGTAVIDFVTEDVGYWGIGNSFYKTTDGGTSWTTQLWTTSQNPDWIDFYDVNHGVVGYWDGTFNYRGGMMSTTDGGQTWRDTLIARNYSVLTHANQVSQSVAFAGTEGPNPQNGGSFLLKTTNSGLSWDSLPIPDTLPNFSLSSFQFTDPLHGLLVVQSDSTSYGYRSNDGGNSWTLDGVIGISQVGFPKIQLIGNVGYLGGAQNQIFRNANLALAVVPEQLGNVELYPNPFSDQLQVRLEKGQNGAVKLYNLQGQLLHEASVAGQLTWALPNLPQGMYLLQIESGDATQTFRVVKQE